MKKIFLGITAEILFKELTSQIGQFVGQFNGVNEFTNGISTEPHSSNYCDIDLEKYQDQFDAKCKGKRQKRGQYRYFINF